MSIFLGKSKALGEHTCFTVSSVFTRIQNKKSLKIVYLRKESIAFCFQGYLPFRVLSRLSGAISLFGCFLAFRVLSRLSGAFSLFRRHLVYRVRSHF